MNKHLRAKVSFFINSNCVAVHRISDNAVVRARPCLPTMTLRKSDGTQDEWLSPSDSDSTKYHQNTAPVASDGTRPVVALRYNWRSVFPASGYNDKCNWRGFYSAFGYSHAHTTYFLQCWLRIGGRTDSSEIFVSDNPFLLRSFAAKLVKLGALSVYRLPDRENIVFAEHMHGCYRIEHNGNGIIVSIGDVRIGEVLGHGRLKSNNECLNYLFDCEVSSQ